MAFTVAEMMKEAREVYLNDTPVGDIFNDDVLMPFARRAFDELNSKLARIGHQVTETVSADLILSAGTKELAIPADCLEPVSLEERSGGSGNDDDFRLMTKDRDISSGMPQQVLGSWDYAQNKLVFRGATTDRALRLRYIRFLPALLTPTQEPVVLNSKSYLSARTAALAAGHIGANPEKAAYIMLDANDALDDLMGIAINAEQSSPTRRRPFRR